MLNTFSLTGICLNSTLFSSSFFFGKFLKAYALNPIVDSMPFIPLFFSVSLCLASCCKFSMRSLIIS